MAASYQVSPPEPFDFTRPDEWEKWSRRFERFRKASGLGEKGDDAQVNTLIYSMGDAADDLLHSFKLDDEARSKYKTVKDRFDQHFLKRRNVIFERAKFNMRRQEEGKSVDTFITALHVLAEHCKYGDLHDEMVRDRIVVGIRNRSLLEKLQLQADLTLETAATQARQAEAVKLQQSVLRSGSGQKPETSVGALQRGRVVRKRKPFKSSSSSGGQYTDCKPADACTTCGRSPAHDCSQCPARNATCRKCGKKGHFQALCRSARDVGGVQAKSIDSGVEPFLGSIGDPTPDCTGPWTLTLSLHGRPVTFSIDTGAEVTVISEKIWQEVGQPTLTSPQRSLRGPDAKPIPARGKFTGTLTYGNRQTQEQVYVVTGLSRPFLGRPAIESLCLIERVASVSSTRTYDPQERFPKLFEGLGKLEGAYTIRLREDAKPFSLSTPRRVAIPLLEPVKQELKRMQTLGVTSRVDQPTEWCSGMVVVPKGNGKVRQCVDLTKLNESVVREKHPLPPVDQILAQLAGAKYFSKLDANSGFWQIPLDPESSLLTTFITPCRRYSFHRLPFGISSAPEHFQRRMSEVLARFSGVVCMMDDILVHGTSLEEHNERLDKVLHRLLDLGMTLNSEKCQFSQTSVKFLGHVVDACGIRPDPGKVSAIQGVPTPTSVGEVRRFLGMTNQMSKFAPHLANMTQPLRELLVKQNAWIWGDAQKDAFEEVKQVLSASPVLSLFDPNLETIVSADASLFGLGAVMKQWQITGELKPVAYISRAMTMTERRYAQIEKEALAMTWACERLSDYLTGIHFHINTDHKPLVPLFSTKNLEELPLRVQRFRLRMMRFSFNIAHVPGK